MGIVYLLTLCVLSLLGVYCSRKATSLEKPVEQADEDSRCAIATIPPLNPVSLKPDPLDEARKRRKIDTAVARLQQLEDRYLKWQGRADSLEAAVTGLLHFRGKVSPYILGAVDSLAISTTLQHFGYSALDLVSYYF